MKSFTPYNKYNARKTIIDGISFDSMQEAKRFYELKLLARAGEISDLRRQVKYPLIVEGEKIGRYVADFVYTDKEGKTVVEDAKGFITPMYRLKKKLMKALYKVTIIETQ